MNRINISNLKKSVYFIGKDKSGKPQAHATGFLIQVNRFYHLVTAKHVVIDKNGNFLDGKIIFFNNGKPGKKYPINGRDINDLKNESVNWVFHQNKDVDIAVIPIKVSSEFDDVLSIPTSAFIESDRLIETQEVLFLSYQPGIEIQNKINPIVRKGIVSLMNDDKTFYIDGFAFPGNSGSPVFHKPPLGSDLKKEDKLNFGEMPGLLGIIGAYLPYSEEAVSLQTGHTRVIFEDNTGLSVVWSIDYLNEIIQSRKFKDQLTHLEKLQKELDSKKAKLNDKSKSS